MSTGLKESLSAPGSRPGARDRRGMPAPGALHIQRLTRFAYAVYALAHRADGEAGPRREIQGLAHATLRDVLGGDPRSGLAKLIETRERLTRGFFSGLRENDLTELRTAFAQLETLEVWEVGEREPSD